MLGFLNRNLHDRAPKLSSQTFAILVFTILVTGNSILQIAHSSLTPFFLPSNPTNSKCFGSTFKIYPQFELVPPLSCYCPSLTYHHLSPGLFQWPPCWSLRFCSCPLQFVRNTAPTANENVSQILSVLCSKPSSYFLSHTE